MIKYWRRAWANPGTLFNLLLIFSVLVVTLLVAGIWLILDWHENDVKDEIEAQREFVSRMIAFFEKEHCRRAENLVSDEWEKFHMPEVTLYMRATSENPEQAKMSFREDSKNLAPFSIMLSEEQKKSQFSCKAANVNFEWLAVKDGPKGNNYPKGPRGRSQYYSLMGFATIASTSIETEIDLSSKTPESASERPVTFYAPMPRLMNSGSRLVALVGAIILSSALLLMTAFLVFIASKPLKYLKAALDEFYGTVAAQGRASPSEIMVNLQKLELRIDTGARGGHPAVRSFHAMRHQLSEFIGFQRAMVGGLSHDLRIGIIRIEHLVTNLQDCYDKKKLLEITRLMRSMTDDTLYILTGKGVREPLEKHDLFSLVTTVADGIEMDSEKICFGIGAGRIVVLAREIALKRAFENLIRNALLYGGGGEISLRTEGRWAVVDIADRGPGMPKDKDVQKPFARGDTARDIRVGGSGLGLTIARDNIQSHGGKVDHLDREGGGTIARVFLPLQT